jgi:CRP-like cAMP-binding protein
MDSEQHPSRKRRRDESGPDVHNIEETGSFRRQREGDFALHLCVHRFVQLPFFNNPFLFLSTCINTPSSPPKCEGIYVQSSRSTIVAESAPSWSDGGDSTKSKSDATIALLVKTLQSHFLFSALDPTDLSIVVDAMSCEFSIGGENIITQGEEGNCFYVLESGECEILVGENKVGTYHSGSAFGELALMYNCPRAATIQAVGMCVLWTLDRRRFRWILATAEAAKIQGRCDFLRKVPLFGPLSSLQIETIARALRSEVYQDGQYIIKQHEQGDKFFLIKAGKVEVTQESVGIAGSENADMAAGASVENKTGESVLTTLGEGEFFGEMALLLDEPRHANCIANSSIVRCYTLDRQQFISLLGPLRELLDRQVKVRVLKCIPMLSQLQDMDLDIISRSLEVLTYKEGEPVYRVGDPSTHLYLVNKGAVHVKKKARDGSATTTVCNVGDFFGDSELQRQVSTEKDETARDKHENVASGENVPAETSSATLRESDAYGHGEEIECLALHKNVFQYLQEDLAGFIYRQQCARPSRFLSNSTVFDDDTLNDLIFVSGGDMSELGERNLAHYPKQSVRLNKEDVQAIRTIGMGSYGRVKLIRYKPTTAPMALKIMHKGKISSSLQFRSILNEKNILLETTHPFVVDILGTFKDQSHIYMALEWVPGGELWSLMYMKRNLVPTSPWGGFALQPSMFYAANVVDVLSYLHALSIAYRDLKPENLLIDSMGYLKFVDFGFAKRIPYIKNGEHQYR